ncbi:winged helix-turn-helix domain-containing protein [Streptomyces sp. NPDC056944]|uniref:helix-turn-helix domain-containing protein n=1 Tax=Streptomyces sp. NPDC056944 TaxID=3345972 RepID=UPI00362D61AB
MGPRLRNPEFTEVWDELCRSSRGPFGHLYTPRGVSYLLHRLGWSPQVPAHRGRRARRADCGARTAAGPAATCSPTWPRKASPGTGATSGT